MATIKQRMWRKNASGTYDTIHLETESGLVLRPSGRTVEQDLTDYLPKTQDSDTPPETLKSASITTTPSRCYIGISNIVREVGIIAQPTDYTSYFARNCSLVDSTPGSMTNGTIAFVY